MVPSPAPLLGVHLCVSVESLTPRHDSSGLSEIKVPLTSSQVPQIKKGSRFERKVSHNVSKKVFHKSLG